MKTAPKVHSHDATASPSFDTFPSGRTIHMRRKTMTFVLVGLLLSAGLAAQQKRQAEIDLQAAIRTETVGDLKSAIKQYENIVKKYSKDGMVAAQALIHMAESYQKLGDPEARTIYERVVQEYPDQKDAAAKALNQLTADRTSVATKRVWIAPNTGVQLGRISRDGRYIPYADWDATGDLFVHDLVTGDNRRVTNTADVRRGGEFPEYSLISRDGRQLAYTWWVGASRYCEIRIVSLQGTGVPPFRRISNNSEVQCTWPSDWSSDGKWIAAFLDLKNGSTQRGIVAVEDGSLRVLKSVNDTTRMAFSPDGKYLAFDRPIGDPTAQRDVYILAIDENREIPAIVHPSRDELLGWSPDGKQLLFKSERSGSPSAWALPFANGGPQGEPRLLKRDMGQFKSIGIADSGALYLAAESSTSSNIHIASVDFSTGKLLSPPVMAVQTYIGSNRWPDWSPDGKSLAYVSERGLKSGSIGRSFVLGIRSVETNEVREKNLPSEFANFEQLHWLADGRSLMAFGQDANGSAKGLWVNAILRIDAETGRTLFVREIPQKAAFIAFSPDGKKMYYSPRADGNQDIAYIELDLSSGVEREIIRRDGLRGSAFLSRDGKYIAATKAGPTARTTSIILIPIQGGEPKELMEGFIVRAWAPDGRSIVATKQSGGLWRVPLDGGEPVKFGDGVPSNFIGNSDGRQIVFSVTERAGPAEVWVLENFLPR
jgi:Tol biopolymer transport system component